MSDTYIPEPKIDIVTAEEASAVFDDPLTIPIFKHGFVRLVDWMPRTGQKPDDAIVEAARVSYRKKGNSSNRTLLRYMLRNRHTSPIEQVELKFHVKAPIFDFRQWHRHRTAQINELSGRYSELPEEYYEYELGGLRLQSQVNKQGSSEVAMDPERMAVLLQEIDDHNRRGFELYKRLVDPNIDVAKELARAHLPVSTYSEMYWKIDLWNFFHFVGLRSDGHAQQEIRVFSDAMYKLVKEHVAPMACEAFEDYIFNAERLTVQDQAALRIYLATMSHSEDHVGAMAHVRNRGTELGMTKREVDEFEGKVSRILSDEPRKGPGGI